MSFYVFVGKWSDRVGRKKPLIIGAIATLVFLFPIFWGLGALANPGLSDSARAAPVAVSGAPVRLRSVRRRSGHGVRAQAGELDGAGHSLFGQ